MDKGEDRHKLAPYLHIQWLYILCSRIGKSLPHSPHFSSSPTSRSSKSTPWGERRKIKILKNYNGRKITGQTLAGTSSHIFRVRLGNDEDLPAAAGHGLLVDKIECVEATLDGLEHLQHARGSAGNLKVAVAEAPAEEGMR